MLDLLVLFSHTTPDNPSPISSHTTPSGMVTLRRALDADLEGRPAGRRTPSIPVPPPSEGTLADTKEEGWSKDLVTRSNRCPVLEGPFGRGLRWRVLHFTPAFVEMLLWCLPPLTLLVIRWFTVNMGCGMCSILIHNLPYQFRGLVAISTVVFVANVVLFTTFLLVCVLPLLRSTSGR